MLKALVCAAMLLQTFSSGMTDLSFRTTLSFKTGILLRLHVVAQDDSAEMQSLKLTVRDGIRTAYAKQPRDPADTMLVHTGKILPILADAARDTAEAEGYDRPVSILLGWFDFDEYRTGALVIPAGRYPALVVRLGEAQGHNWWGLIDPAASLEAAALDDADPSVPLWDWSWEGFLAALIHSFHLPGAIGE